MMEQEFKNTTAISYMESQACKDVWQINIEISARILRDAEAANENLTRAKANMAQKLALDLLKEGYLDPSYYVVYQWVEGYVHLRDERGNIMQSGYRVRLKAHVIDKEELESLQKQKLLGEILELTKGE